MWKNARWIGIPAGQIPAERIYAGDLNGRFAYFRKAVVCREKPESCRIDITANTRYRLWINSKPVLSGPCKGDWHSHYYETVDVAEYLHLGENVFAVQVLFLNPFDVGEQYGNERTPILSAVSCPVGHRLALEGEIFGGAGRCLAELTTGETGWQVYLDSSYYIKCKEVNCNSGGFCEDVDFRKAPVGWKEPGYECRMADGGHGAGYWWDALPFETVLPGGFQQAAGFTGKFQVKERPILLLFEEEEVLTAELGTHVFEQGGQAVDEILVSPGRQMRMVFAREQVTNAYMRYSFTGGHGTRVAFTYFEKFVKEGEDILRDDWENGTIEGMSEEIWLPGGDFTFEPFWVRTFRFIEIVLEAGEEPVRFARPHFRRTGYPLRRISHIKSRQPWVEEIWEMCVATLQNCMLETYMDCPFYEQMQFVMDTRLQALFHYAVDGDTRLAEKALWDFHCSMTPEGLMHGKYPCSFPQIISTFSLYFIFMLRDYYWQTGNVASVKRYRSDVDAILEYYDRRIGACGLVEQVGYWAFVDWQKAWAQTGGVPAAAAQGPSAIHNLMYAYGLQCGAELAGAAGRDGLKQEYLERQQAVCRRVRELCWDRERGMYREGPDFAQYSQHAQSWAALNGMGTKEERRKMLLHAMTEPDVLPCSFSTSYELFRALEQENLYEETEVLMKRWAALREKHCTTCPEEPDKGRSENHAWSALPIYEMMRKLAGVEPGEPGWKTVLVRPHLEYLAELQGEAATPMGTVEFRYVSWERMADDMPKADWQEQFGSFQEHKGEGTDCICCLVTLPKGLSGIFCLPDGSRQPLQEGENRIIFRLDSWNRS